ncbi:MAG: CDP-alcohol phosphatidyltransferase family protein [Crocinitomicaceae bacterium]
MFSIPNFFTASNLICGVLGIIFSLSGRIDLAPWLVFVALICDFLDGFLARKLKQASELGKQLDSLADMVTFGVLPGVVCFILLIIGGANEIVHLPNSTVASPWLSDSFGQSVNALIDMYVGDLTGNPITTAPFHFYGWYLFVPFIALLIPFFSLFRLAKFNLDKRQSDQFIGLPTPANTLFFMAFPLMLWDGWGTTDWKSTISLLVLKDSILTSFIVLFSFLLIAELPLIALKFKTFKWKKNESRYILIMGSCILIMLLSLWSIPIIVFLYLILSIIDNSTKKIKK